MVNYVRLVQTASRLIANNGRAIQFFKFNEIPNDSNQPWKGPAISGEQTLELNGVFVPPNTVREFGLSALGEGTGFEDLIAFSQQVIIVAQGENDLREYTTVIDRDQRWGIVGLQVLRPGNTTVLGFVGVRR